MEFHEKLQALRKGKGLTQEELASKLFVSRTAVSKWESGRGYPNIQSLKAIASIFSVTVDELLSTNEALTIAEAQQKQTEKSFRAILFGFLDLCFALFLFLPLFSHKTQDGVEIYSLLTLKDIMPYVKILYFISVGCLILTGILTFALQGCTAVAWTKSKTKISLAFGVLATLLFMISAQPYASALAFCLLAVKGISLLKRQ